ncbi:M20/M25/M40 family metallo-hydrolase [Ruania zhangjianzhongii]|uniref:M20/M25/M40 family metallo-hydrolase n=1 Tax=Ruania zhangjianzhongii TaxID=2603206 RepID=UPI0011C6FB79|nr:M20/M25/M40 family metallo-hydrolase [Ruania zhangjianzhongii]
MQHHFTVRPDCARYGPHYWLQHNIILDLLDVYRDVRDIRAIYAYPGGTDASYFLGRGQIPTVTSLGPGLLSVAHGPNEYVPVRDLYTAVELYTRLFESLTGPTD